jgi:pyruvate/2-oxoglutarate dehydrogenase complex dihydrolipoamide acyltransferase (E2) component
MTHDTHTIKPFPPSRHFFIDGMEFGGRKHCIHGLIEVDVTNPRQHLLEIKQRTGESLSFTGFIIYCCARVVDQNKLVHAYRDWHNRLILFDEVDIYVPVERSAGGPLSHTIIRAANRKSVKDIHREIRQAQSKATPDAAADRFMRWYVAIPRFLRRSFFPAIYGVPRLFKKYMGTVMVTSVGMFGTGGGWGIGPVGHSLTVTVGGIVSRPCVKNGQLENREHLCLTITFDHDVINGAPAARFLQQFKELIESGSGLFEE